MTETFTIEAKDMPSQKVSISFREPTFSDRVEASRRYPATNRAGFLLEELLASMCITGFNDNPLPSAPRDPIDYLKELDHVDGQYFIRVFLTMFTVDEELAKQANDIGLKMKTSADLTHTVPKDVLPGSGKAFSFRVPTLGDRMELDRRYPGADSNCGYSLEEMMFCQALVSVDGSPVERSRDYVSVLSDWTHLDSQFALSVFISAITIDKTDESRAKSLGKSLRNNVRATPQKSTKATTSKSSKEDTTTQA
jgi:hypothetical protein